MPRTVQSSIHINRPPEQVFSYVAHFENDPRWRTDVQELRLLDPGEVHIGQRLSERATVWGQKLETVTKITELEPGRRVKVVSISGPVPVAAIRTCQPVNGGTLLTYTLEADVNAVLLFRIFQPVLIPYYHRQVAKYLRNLKQILE